MRSDGLEGYARTFLAAAFRVAGADGKDPHGWLDRYADGLAAGTRTPGRDDAESWPLILDHHVQGQPMVESASVALGLRLTRPWLWDRLDAGVQDRAEEWLRGALRHTPAPNNWYLFPFTVAAFLESVGRGDAETARAQERALDLLEALVPGRGLVRGRRRRAPSTTTTAGRCTCTRCWTRTCPATPRCPRTTAPGCASTWTASRCCSARDGAPIHFGRSLTYRFAAGRGGRHSAPSPGTPRSRPAPRGG